MQQGNAELLVTVRAGESESLRLSSVSLPQGPQTPGARWFAKTGLSRFISPQTGCVISPQISFANDTEVLYVTLRAWNVRAGLQLSVQWWHESEPVHSEAYVLPAGQGRRVFLVLADTESCVIRNGKLARAVVCRRGRAGNAAVLHLSRSRPDDGRLNPC